MQIPTRIGKYELVEFLGGKVAEVYRARDCHLGRDVALKILSTAALNDLEAKARFLAEARVTGSLAHENIIAFYDYGETNGRPFLVLEYLAGEGLRDAIRKGYTGDLKNKLRIARRIASALAYVHSKGVVHRDVKPGNVRIGTGGEVKLMDFGIAKADQLSLTGAGFTVGTPYYMAPEQIRGRSAAPTVDVYGFGVLLYEMVTGARPFEGGTVDEIFDRILHQPLDQERLEKAGAPRSMRDLIRLATDKDPAKRPQDFGAVGAMLDALSAAGPNSL